MSSAAPSLPTGPSGEPIHFSTEIDGVDWQALRESLIADDFDNGRTPEEYALSAQNSALNVFAYYRDAIIGNARVLSDGVCNAYVVDVWTRSDLRRRGIASEMLRRILDHCPGQQIYLWTDDGEAFYESNGFWKRGIGMEKVSGTWLNRKAPIAEPN